MRFIIFYIFLFHFSAFSFSQDVYAKKQLLWIQQNSANNPQECFEKLLQLEKKRFRSFDFRFEVVEELARFSLFELRDFSKAMQYMDTLKEEVDQQKDFRYQIKLHNSIGELYYFEGINISKSYEEFKKALHLMDTHKSDYLSEVIYNNYALSLMSEGKFKASNQYLNKALQISKEKNNNWLNSIILNNIGVNYLYLNERDSAESYFQESLDFAQLTPEKSDDLQRNLFLGLFYNDQNQPDQALSYFKQAEKLVSKNKSFQDKMTLYKGLAKSYELNKNYPLALLAKNKQLQFKDSVEFYNLKKEAFVYDYEISLKKLRTKNQVERVKNQKIKLQIVIAVMAIFILMGAIGFLMVRGRKNKQLMLIEKERALLEQENLRKEKIIAEKESASKSMFLLEKDNLLHNITNKLKDTLPQMEDDSQRVVQEVIRDLKGTVNVKRWEEFEIRFLKINPHFFEKLEVDFPQLSANEKKLCAFLSMNLNSKEISNITGQTPHAINIARGRLRKKLQINQTTVELNAFLKKYS